MQLLEGKVVDEWILEEEFVQDIHIFGMNAQW